MPLPLTGRKPEARRGPRESLSTWSQSQSPGPRAPHLLSSCRARPSRLQEMWGAGYPEAEQRTLTSTPWEKRWDLVWMLTCGASAVQRVDRWGRACQSGRAVPGPRA